VERRHRTPVPTPRVFGHRFDEHRLRLVGRTPDYTVSREEVLSHLASLTRGVSLPVNADFEAGFAKDPAAVAESVTLAIATGLVGLSIEDRDAGGGRGSTTTVVAAARELKGGRFDCLSSGVPSSALEEAFRPSDALKHE
jgi:Phosphoenolpyruvate phosphomutase